MMHLLYPTNRRLRNPQQPQSTLRCCIPLLPWLFLQKFEAEANRAFALVRAWVSSWILLLDSAKRRQCSPHHRALRLPSCGYAAHAKQDAMGIRRSQLELPAQVYHKRTLAHGSLSLMFAGSGAVGLLHLWRRHDAYVGCSG